jgi:TP901 family phage tail tape measure protein
MADVNANIGINLETSAALAQLKDLQRQLAIFNTSISKTSASAVAGQKKLAANLVNSINDTGKFVAEIRSIDTTVESFTKNLEKNKFSVKEYFRFAGASTKTFGRNFKGEFDTINKVAEDRVKRLSTQYIKLGRDATGTMQAISVMPKSLDMSSYSTQMQMSAQRQALFNQLVKQGSTGLINFGKNTQWAGRQLMVGFTIPLMILGSTASKTFLQMEEAAINFRKVYGDLFTPTAEREQALQDITALGEMFTKYGIAVSETVALAADAAAAGFSGLDLQRQTTEATRLSVLGQIDTQKALTTTIALQNAFKISSEEMADSINFLNAVENQTVLSLEDVTEAIPRVGPIIEQLGGNVKDLAFFLTAMKEGGVSAAQGANALKSGLASLIAPSDKAAAALMSYGININKIVEGNQGNLRQTVIDFAASLDTLDPLNRSRAIEQLFGKFQFARLSALFNNITTDGTQASRVLDLAGASIEELAGIAESELAVVSDATGTKFKKAMEDLKLALMPVGEEFLKAATPIVEFVSGILERFNNLSDGSKKAFTIIIAAIGGLAPVILMSFGLLNNLIGNAIKFALTLRQGYLKLTGQSNILSQQTNYLTLEQTEAMAAAHSLNQSHAGLTQVFNVEREALMQLIAAYQTGTKAAQNFANVNRNFMAPGFNPNILGPNPKRYNKGVVMVPGSGNTDKVPAMLTPGESVIPKEMTKRYAPLIEGMISGNIPGYKMGGISIGGSISQLDFTQSKTAAKSQRLVDEIIAEGSGIANGLDIVNEAISRMANDTKISIKTFTRELEVVTKELTGKMIPPNVLSAAGRPQRRSNASQAGIGSLTTQVSGNPILQEELSRAQNSAAVAQKAVKDYYSSIGKDASEFSKIVEETGKVHRSHVINIKDNVDKMFKEAWDPNAWVVQSSSLNQVANILQQSEPTRDEYLKNLTEINADEQIVSSIRSKITNNIALTEKELVVQKLALERMLKSTESMARVSAGFAPQAVGAIASTEYLMKNPPVNPNVGLRSLEQQRSAELSLSQARFRGNTSFIRQTALSVSDEVVKETARAAGTQSPSRRTIPIGQDIARGLEQGMLNRIDDVGRVAGQLGQTAVTESGLIIPANAGRTPSSTSSSGSAGGIIPPKTTNPGPADDENRARQQNTKAIMSGTDRLQNMNRLMMSGSFALTSLAGAGSFAGGRLGELSNNIFKVSGLLFGLQAIIQLLTDQMLASLIANRLAVAKQAAAFASYGTGISGRAGLLGKIGQLAVGIGKFLGPWGALTAAVASAYAVWRIVKNQREQERESIESLGNAAKLTAEQVKTLGDFFGVVPQALPSELTGDLFVTGPQERTQLEALKENEEFKEQFKKTIQTLKSSTNSQIELTLQTLGLELSARGFANEQIDLIVKAIQEKAGKTDLAIEFKSFDIDNYMKNLNKLSDRFQNQIEKQSQRTTGTREWVKNAEGELISVEKFLKPTKEYEKFANAFGTNFANAFDAISGQVRNGVIDVEQYKKQIGKLTNSFEDLDQAAKQVAIAKMLKDQDKKTRDAIEAVENEKHQVLLLTAAYLGLNVAKEAAILAQPVNDGKEGLARTNTLLALQERMNQNLLRITKSVTAEQKALGEGTGDAGKEISDFDTKIKEVLTTLKNLKDASINTSGGIGELIKVLAKGGTGIDKFNGIAQQMLNMGKVGLNREFIDYVTSLDQESQKAFISIDNGVVKLTKNGRLLNKSLKQISIGDLSRSFKTQVKDTRAQIIAFNKLRASGFSVAEALKAVANSQFALAIATSKTSNKTKELIKDYLLLQKIEKEFEALDPEAAFNKQMEDFDKQERDIELKYELDIMDAEDAVAAAEDAVEAIQKEIEKLEDELEPIRRKVELEYDRPIETLQRESNVLSNELTLLDKAASEINKKYDKQAEALNKIFEINQDILAQEKSRISLADALTRGDISAAAQAMQEMRQTQANARKNSTTSALELARENEISRLRSISGKTRLEIETRQFAISQQIFKLEQDKLVLLDLIRSKEDNIYRVRQELEKAEDNLYAKRETLQKLEDDREKELRDLQRERIQAEIDHLKGLTDVAQGAVDKVKEIDKSIQDIKDKTVTITVVKKNVTEGGGGSGGGGSNNAGEKDSIDDTNNPFKDVGPNFRGVGSSGYDDNRSPAQVGRDSAAKQDAAAAKRAQEAKAAADGAAARAKNATQIANVAKQEAAAASRGKTKPATPKTIADLYRDAQQYRAGGGMISKIKGYAMGGVVRVPPAEPPPAQMMNKGGKVNYMPMGGLVPYMNMGGIFKPKGTDTVPAMLTPGEFVIRKYAVKDFGLDKLKAINEGTYNDGSVYNYNLSLNVKSESNPDQIAETVIAQIKRIDGQRIRGNRQ